MKQLVQDFKTGEIKLVEVPEPVAAPGLVVVRNAFSLVSAGTEKSTVEMGQASLVQKARLRPDLVRQVIGTVKKEGIAATVRKVQSRLDTWKQLGYSSAGTVIAVGDGVTEFAVGDRVACAGQDYASHAEVVAVPKNLCAKIPEGMRFEQAAFTTLGVIALQGVRQADARLGDRVAVIGLGLVGRLTVLLLQAAGCRVFGYDPVVKLPGVESPEPDSMDAVIITAATSSNEPVELAGTLCRDRGRVVMVGVTGMNIPRDVYFKKELEFRLSRSYGPGRYDPLYEEHGVDYPIGYVRWTEQRNMEAFLQLRLDLAPLITHRFPVTEAVKAYDLITGKTGERFVGVLIEYGKQSAVSSPRSATPPPAPVVLGVIGAGNYAQGVLLPQFKANKDVTLATVCTATGVKAEKAREKFGFANATTDWRSVVADKAINTVLVATRHDLHAPIVVAALQAGKTVFCEKPLCLSEQELEEILQAGSDRLMVGFNRRFAPFSAAVRQIPGPRVMRYRVNAGPLPKGHWANDPVMGGGRILGEVCHFVDYLQFAAQARPVTVFAQGFGADNVQVALRFADGSVGSVDYFSVADRGLDKEHFEIFGGGQHLVVDNFSDKGQAEEVRQFVAAVKAGSPMPIPFAEIIASTRATFAILQANQTGTAVTIGPVG